MAITRQVKARRTRKEEDELEPAGTGLYSTLTLTLTLTFTLTLTSTLTCTLTRTHNPHSPTLNPHPQLHPHDPLSFPPLHPHPFPSNPPANLLVRCPTKLDVIACRLGLRPIPHRRLARRGSLNLSISHPSTLTTPCHLCAVCRVHPSSFN